MVDECAQAISFAEHYFALVDGIFPGFENNLAENVVLNWFGKTIKGKENVTAFIKSDQTSTLHIFNNITPISGIVCNKKRCNRKRRITLDQITDIEEKKLETDTNKQKANRSYKNAVKYLDKVKIIDYTVREDNSTNVETYDCKMNEENDTPDDLFEPEITSVDDEEIQRNINESKLEEEMASTVKPIKREYGQGDRTVRAQTGTIKYIEANGQVKFTRRVLQEDPWSYHWTSLKINYWAHNCKLQIAYSHRNVNECPGVLCMLEHVSLTRKCKKSNNIEMQPQKKLPTLEEIIEISNRLIPDVNKFGGYLKSLNYVKDRDNFLKDFEAIMAQKNPDTRLPTMHYDRNKLIFEYKNDVHRENLLKKFLHGNYQIHRIVYEKAEMDENWADLVEAESNEE